MEWKGFISLLFAILMGFLCSSEAYDFYVGGRDGWVLNPSANFNQWAERMRFQVNDTIVFKYKKGSDSVLVVNKEDYYKCNTTKPIMSMVDGDSMLKFDRSGPFFFISGNPGTCEKGQKLIVVVLAVRHKGDHAPSPQLPPSSPSPSPTFETPMWSPTPSPMAKTPVWPPSPAGSPMSLSPMTWTPSFPPTAMTPSPMVSPPSTMDPLPAPPMANTPTSETPMGEAPTPDTSSDMHAPALAPSSSPTFTFLIGYVLVVVSVVWCSFFGPV